MYKKLFSILLVVAFVFSLTALAASASSGASAEVASIKGRVTVKRASSEKTVTAFAGMKLSQGDVVTTAAGAEAVVKIGADLSIKALSDSSFKITSLSTSKTGFTLIKGTVFNQASGTGAGSNVSVRTGNTVVGVRGTTFTVSLRGEDGSTLVRTLEGTVFLESVRKRLEADENASLIGDEAEVGAGEGAGSDGVFELNIGDLTADELEYILEHPGEFDDEIVEAAREALEDMDLDFEDADEGDVDTEIRYRQSQPIDLPTPQVKYDVTFVNNESDGHYLYYSPGGTIRVAAGDTIPASQFPPAVMLGSSFIGWSESEPDSLDQYVEFVPGSTQVTGDTLLYPWFERNDDITFGGNGLPWEDGSPGSPFRITQANFPHFRYVANTSIWGLDCHYLLTEDINCTAYTLNGPYGWDWDWMPIGDDANPFTGSFDGDYHTISGFSCTSTSGSGSDIYAGFFGCIAGDFTGNGKVIEEVCNLTINGTIDITNSGIFSRRELHVGGIVGSMSDGIITQCSTAITINITGVGPVYSGGIVGSLTGGDLSGFSRVEHCSSSGDITATITAGDQYDTVMAGGIIGYAEHNGDGAFLSNCHSSSDVYANAAMLTGYSYAGGIIGYAENPFQVEYCYYSGPSVRVDSLTTGNYNAGGIAGRIDMSFPSISNCVMYQGTVDCPDRNNAGRIWGVNASTGTGQYNYSDRNVLVGAFNVPDPGYAYDRDGENVGVADLTALSWWQTASFWDSVEWDISGYLSDSTIWFFHDDAPAPPTLRWQLPGLT